MHGGAIPVERLRFEPTLSVRDAVMTAEKERIELIVVGLARDLLNHMLAQAKVCLVAQALAS